MAEKTPVALNGDQYADFRRMVEANELARTAAAERQSEAAGRAAQSTLAMMQQSKDAEQRAQRNRRIENGIRRRKKLSK